MITTTLLTRHAPSIARRLPPLRSSLTRTSITGLQLARPQWLPPTSDRRWESTAAKQARSPYKYPSLLNIYLAPTAQTMSWGILRLTTLVLLALGLFIYVPAIYSDPEAPTWLIPAAALGSAVPFAAAVASGPFITSVRVHLPNNARRSKDALMAFANNTPPSTRVRLQFIRSAPWLVSREVLFRDFRRLPKSWTRLANLENVGAREEDVIRRYGRLGRVVGGYATRYWVNLTSTGKDRSSVPGVWERMWGQIPMAGEEVAMKGGKGGERKPVTMANRQQVLPPQAVKKGGRR